MKPARAALGALAAAAAWWSALLAGAAAGGPVPPPPAPGEPTMALDRAGVAPGDQVGVDLQGWAGRVVTLSTCGNLAAAGSADCDMPSSQGVTAAMGQPGARAQFRVTAPPSPCPCVVRASSLATGEVVTAPIEISGHPIGRVAPPAPQRLLLDVSIRAERSPRGALEAARSWLGGPTDYEVTVVVRNRSSVALSGISLAGSGGRSARDSAVTLELPDPGEIPPGQAWRHTASATLPAPVLGAPVWRVSASGAGAAVSAEHSPAWAPWGLVALLALLALDLGAFSARRLGRHRAARRAAAGLT